MQQLDQRSVEEDKASTTTTREVDAVERDLDLQCTQGKAAREGVERRAEMRGDARRCAEMREASTREARPLGSGDLRRSEAIWVSPSTIHSSIP